MLDANRLGGFPVLCKPDRRGCDMLIIANSSQNRLDKQFRDIRLKWVRILCCPHNCGAPMHMIIIFLKKQSALSG